MNFNTKNIVANGAVILILVVGVVSAAKSILFKKDTPPCNERYGNYIRFPDNVGVGEQILDKNIELHLDGRVQGLSEFTKVVQTNASASRVAFETKLPKGSLNPLKNNTAKGGMGFFWRPTLPTRASSACLTYKMWLPVNFKFNKGGTLPGLYGGKEPGPSGFDDPLSGFASSLKWSKRGRPVLRSLTSEITQKNGLLSKLGSDTIPKGRWVEISQEVVLNAAGLNDGIQRVWIDGELRHEAENIAFRKKNDLEISGVQAQIHYDGKRKNGAGAPNDTLIRITPFVLNWK